MLEPGTWYYDSPIGTLSVDFKGGVVSFVRPREFELGVLSAKTLAERTAFITAIRAKAEAEANAERERQNALRAEAAAADEAARAEAVAAAAADRKGREAKPLVRVTYAQAVEIMKRAASEAGNRDDFFSTAFLNATAGLAPEFFGAKVIERSDVLTIAISGPLARFYKEATERLRKFEALTPPPAWQPVISISVSPEQINAPDIEKVIVQRNGVIVPPLRNALVPREMITAMGIKKIIHSGVVTFPTTAFEPAADVKVTITAIPMSGTNIVHTLGSLDLRAIQ